MVKLDIGCGTSCKPGWTGVDARGCQGVSVVCKAWELPHHENTVDMIHTRHMIEHLTLSEAIRAFKVWFRALKPGGELHIICPNRDFHVQQLMDPDRTSEFGPWSNLEHGLAGLHGWQNNPEDIHKWSWTVSELQDTLQEVGFSVTVQDCRVCDVEVVAVKP